MNNVERRVFNLTGDDYVLTLTLLRGIYSALNIESNPQVAFDKVLEALKGANDMGREFYLSGLCVETWYTRPTQDLDTLGEKAGRVYNLALKGECFRTHTVHFLLKKREEKSQFFRYDVENECFYALGYSYSLETENIELNRLSFKSDGLVSYLLP